MKEATIIAQQRTVIRFCAARICDLLQWQPAEYNFFIYEMGIAYLDAWFKKDEQAINQISTRKEFWSWWKTEWHQRDEAYRNDIDGREDEIGLSQRINLYRATHNVQILICEIALPRLAYPPDFHTVKMEM